MTALYVPRCTCPEDSPFHLPACAHFDPSYDPAAGPDWPREGDPFTAIRMKYADRDTEDL